MSLPAVASNADAANEAVADHSEAVDGDLATITSGDTDTEEDSIDNEDEYIRVEL